MSSDRTTASSRAAVRSESGSSRTGHTPGTASASSKRRCRRAPAMPPQHVHRDHDEVFIVTQGKLRFTSGAENVDVEAGSCVTVPAGTPHTFSNPFDAPATFIGTMTPDLYIEYFRDLGRLPVKEQGMLDPPEIGRTVAKKPTHSVPVAAENH